MAEDVARMGETINSYKILEGDHLEYWEDWGREGKIKMDLREISCEPGTWMALAQNSVKEWTVVLVVLNLWVLVRQN